MTEEYFDVVDEQDRVTGQQLRREVHRLGLRHRAIHVLIYNQRGELFLQKRSMSKDCFPGTWDSSASGHLAPGETYDACALREVQEELGLTLNETPERIMRLDACLETGQEFVWVYRARSDGPFQLHPEEIETGGWFSPEAITRWLWEKPDEFANAFAFIWRKIATGST